MSAVNLRFGIPSLDAVLIGETERRVSRAAGEDKSGGIILSAKSEGTSVCLIGPDGTGKSVFSLHLASQYLWDLRSTVPTDVAGFPKIIYISTDLRFEMAERMFESFQLERSVSDRENGSSPEKPVKLRKLATADTSDLADVLLNNAQDRIGFVDLASDSAGDDWGLVTRIVSLLPEQEEGVQARHLLLIDAVEGLETLAGETDAYGQKVSRRARIALLMRLASHKSHLALVVEEAKEGTRLPEEFVADIVIRLRSMLVNGYTRRTLEIEKARGQAYHARGQHPFQIRSMEDEKPAHVTIYPSLHYQGNSLGRQRNRREGTSEVVSFGIRHLDSLLKCGPDGRFGLHAGLPFAIVGDKGTLKSNLADSFLAGCLADVARNFKHAEVEERGWRASWDSVAASAGVGVLCTSKERSDLGQSLTRQLLNSNRRAARLLRGGSGEARTEFEEYIAQAAAERIKLDPLVVQDQPGPRVYHRIENLIYKATQRLKNIEGLADRNHLIRLVMDDVSDFRDAYPELHEDPLVLPLVLQLARFHGISTLLVATQPMRPDPSQLRAFDVRLRAQVEGYLSTWRVPFFGETRTAITFISATESERRPTVRQVLQVPEDSGYEPFAVDVDPEFELYDGLETERPQRVPLEVRLYIETSAFRKYVDVENEVLKELFEAAVCTNGGPEVITGGDWNSYDALRDYCYLNASGKLMKTLILQVDEFWRPAKRLEMFVNLGSYASAEVDGGDASDPYEDQYAVFRLKEKVPESSAPDPPSHQYPRVRTRRDFFPEFRRPGPTEEALVDRIPFMWDFGFLLLSHNDWYSAASTPLRILSRSLWDKVPDPQKWRKPESEHLDSAFWQRVAEEQQKNSTEAPWFIGFTVGTILDALRKPAKCLEARSAQLSDYDGQAVGQMSRERCLFRGPSSWRAVLEAAEQVRARRAARETTVIRSFDLARPSAESFSSLVLEIWLSEIVERYSWRLRGGLEGCATARQDAEEFLRKLSCFEFENQFSLEDLVEKYELELYMTWMLLVESIDFDGLVDRNHRFALRANRDPTPAMAARHWYKTAAEAASANYSEEPALPVRLPGYFSTRGDWYLAMAAGSRSYRLGTRALDLLNSRRSNITRLQYGLGLPVRDVMDPAGFERFRTKLSYVNYGGRRATVDYVSLIGLGGDSTRRYLCADRTPDSPDSDIDQARCEFTTHVREPGNSFFWIWRSRMRLYDRHARIWTKWLTRTALVMQGIRNDQSAVWRNGYEVYDSIAAKDKLTDDVKKLPSYKGFCNLIKFLKLELSWATPKRESSGRSRSPKQPDGEPGGKGPDSEPGGKSKARTASGV
jgi:KaiC/GvpD/RAD55 family RecA-like ATPase